MKGEEGCGERMKQEYEFPEAQPPTSTLSLCFCLLPGDLGPHLVVLRLFPVWCLGGSLLVEPSRPPSARMEPQSPAQPTEPSGTHWAPLMPANPPLMPMDLPPRQPLACFEHRGGQRAQRPSFESHRPPLLFQPDYMTPTQPARTSDHTARYGPQSPSR